jgi:hypothetical protein
MKQNKIHAAISIFATLVITGTFVVASLAVGSAFAQTYQPVQSDSMGTNMQAGNMSGGASNQSSTAGNMTSGNMTSGNDTAPHAAKMTADKTLASNGTVPS